MEPLANLIDQLLKLGVELKPQAGLELTALEIADALWLAQYLPPPAVPPLSNENTSTPESIDPVEPKPSLEKDSSSPDSPKIDSSEKVKQEDDLVQHRSSDSSQSTEAKSAKKERVYSGYALSKRSQIERSLRPLRRRAPSAIESELDEEGTVERSAQFILFNIRIIEPILRAAQRRWLEVDLIVDNSNSMVVWQETALEFDQLIRHQGVRAVRMWHLDTENTPTISPFRKKQGFTSLTSSTKLPPAQGDRIVLVITDCVAPAWQNFQAFYLLADWAKHSNVTLLQVWPEYFWFRTILRNIDTRASAYDPAVPNVRFITQREPDPFFDFLNEKDSQQTTNSVFIPVVPLDDPDALSKWAQVVAGMGRFWLPAVEVQGDIAVQPEANSGQESRSTETDPRKLVDRFQATASPVTQELGGLLASVPLELPIMRLVQETLPNSHRLHLSEFLTSGLVYRKRSPENSLTDEPVFEFVNQEIRTLLRRTVRISDTIKALEKVGEFIEARVGQGKGFDALRLSETGDKSVTLNQQTLAFAKLKVEVLESLGPFHRISVEQLREEIADGEAFIELKKQLQTFEFDIVTFVSEDEPSPPEIEAAQQQPIEIFFSYAHGDTEDVLNGLVNNLRHWERGGVIKLWDVRKEIKPGDYWIDNINQALDTADIFILLLSPEFLGSDYCRDVEGFRAMERFDAGEAIVLPILARECDWRALRLGPKNTLLSDINMPTTQPILVEGEIRAQHLADAAKWIEQAINNLIEERKSPRRGSGEEKPQQLSQFEFETVTVDAEGRKIGRPQGRASYFTEDLAGVPLEMVAIPEGTFVMGSPKDEPKRHEAEGPQHPVTVSAFFIGKYPVTQAQWRAVAAMPQINQTLDPDPSRFKGDNRPVEKVNWHDAVEFCDRLSRYTGQKYRLPSEAEWEYACRAGTTTPFYFGDTITSELANFNANNTYREEAKGEYRQETTSVGSFTPNVFGLYNMHGDVWEWCVDRRHRNYQGAPVDGSAWISGNANSRVVRGGGWHLPPVNCRSAYRYALDPETRSNDVGFRVVCSALRTQ